MPVPTYDRFIEPILRYLASHPEGAAARDVHDAAAEALGLTDGDRAELLPSGTQPVYKNRAGWAHDRLKRRGYSASVRRGFWKLTESGQAYARANQAPLSADMVEALSVDTRDEPLGSERAATTRSAPQVFGSAVASPDDRLEQALKEIRDAVVAEVLEALHLVAPQRFETIVLDVLHALGYGTSREALQQVGGVGDGGIDGVISLDRLGLEKVYVQAKRWEGSIGGPQVQGFYGALAGQRANKGVFITTSTFTPPALAFAKSVEKIVLIDGERLAGLMTDHEVGVTHRPIRIAKLDSDYFDE